MQQASWDGPHDWCVFPERSWEDTVKLAFVPPSTESTGNLWAIFFRWGYIHTFVTPSKAEAQTSLRYPLPFLHPRSLMLKWTGSCYSHYLKVMMRVNKFHAASTQSWGIRNKLHQWLGLLWAVPLVTEMVDPSNCKVASPCQRLTSWFFLHVSSLTVLQFCP